MATVRTFVAVEIDGGIRSSASRLIGRLQQAGANVKWVEPENLHLTLSFLGEVDVLEVAKVCELVNRAVTPLPEFEIEFFGAGAFPTAHRPRTLWLGVRAGAEEMVILQGAIEAQLTELGFRGEQRRFRPHLTIGRVKQMDQGSAELARLIQQHAEFVAGSMLISEVVIMSSRLDRRGPEYEPLGHAELNG